MPNPPCPRMELRLHSPVGAGREFDLVYSWPTGDASEKYSEEDLVEEIRETISAVLVDHPNLRLPFRIPPITALCSYNALNELCNKWNATVDSYTEGRTFQNTKASLPQAQHIIGQVYNKSVIFPERLNQYEAFSSHVYGETSPKMVSHMIRQLRITENDTFLDLGSGVGQVVLQMAAAADFKQCVGIETSTVPCEYAVGLQEEFQKTMKWYGKSYSKFRLYNGDFLDKKFRDTIQKSTIVFANNFAFGPEVDHHLKEIFADLDDGVRIVSSKQFSPVNFRINQRNLSDIGTIMNVTAMRPFEGAVSWTNSRVCFFLHVIDRSRLERYFAETIRNHQNGLPPAERQKRRSTKETSERSEHTEDVQKKRRSRQSLKKKPRRSDNSASRLVVEGISIGDDGPSQNNSCEMDEPPVLIPEVVTLMQPPPKASTSEKSENRSKPPKKRKSELDILLSSNWDLCASQNVGTSRVETPGTSRVETPGSSRVETPRSNRVEAPGSSQPEDPYANAPWRNVQITSGPPKSVDEMLARMRVQYFEMIEIMKNRAYVNKVVEDIRIERERNEQLRKTKAYLEKVVEGSKSQGKQLLMSRLAELGYDEDNCQYIVAETQSLWRDQVDLSLKVATLKRDIAVLEHSIADNYKKQGVICDIHEQIQKKRLLEKTVSKLTFELHDIEGKTPPKFPDSPPSDCEFNDETIMGLPLPARLYVNDVRVYDRHIASSEVLQKSVSVPAASANESAIPPQYKISSSSILPKKRR